MSQQPSPKHHIVIDLTIELPPFSKTWTLVMHEHEMYHVTNGKYYALVKAAQYAPRIPKAGDLMFLTFDRAIQQPGMCRLEEGEQIIIGAQHVQVVVASVQHTAPGLAPGYIAIGFLPKAGGH